jgi:hypothetical protein
MRAEGSTEVREDDFIDLDRQFVEFDPRINGVEEDPTDFPMPHFRNTKSWRDVLSNRCSVIISEAGTGKTSELQHQALALRAAGQEAFFCQLELLAKFSFVRAIRIGTADDFCRWQDGKMEGYFFLDSVDEAKLTSPADFEAAIVNLALALQMNIDRATIVISTRPTAWLAYKDREMLTARLGLSPAKAPTLASVQDNSSSEDFEQVAFVATRQDDKWSAVVVLKLAPLSITQVRKFACARGVTEIEAFIEAIEQADADVFATRPADLPGLIEIWQKKRRIARYTDVVFNNIQLKLREANPTHQHTTIAFERAIAGAEDLAAAVALVRRTSILLPDHPPESTLPDLLDPGDILTAWTPGETLALLGRALFDESLYGTVRFHHRIAREYLTAQWLSRLLRQRKGRRSIEALLFAKPYGVNAEIVIPSMKPIAAWLAASDQTLRDKLMRIDPKVLLEHADSSALDVSTRAALLKYFAARYRGRKYTSLTINHRELRRLADPALADTVRQLLTAYEDDEAVRKLLLRTIWEGRIPGCGDIALTFALNDLVDTHTRAFAIEAVGHAGAPEQKRDLVRRIVTNSATFDREALAAAIESLWPAFLSCTDLISILASAAPGGAYSFDSLDGMMDHVSEKLLNPEEQLALLRGLVELISRSPRHDAVFCRISKQFSWLMRAVIKLARRLLESDDRAYCYREVVEAVAMGLQVNWLQRYTGDTLKVTSKLIRDNRNLRHALFWHETERARQEGKAVRDYLIIAAHYDFNFLEISDFGLFERAIEERPLVDDKLVALSALVRISGRDPKLLKRIEQAIGAEPVLRKALADWLAPFQRSQAQIKTEEDTVARKKQREAEEQERARAREEWILRLRRNPSEVGDLTIAAESKLLNNTVQLASELKRLSNSSTRLTAARWELLAPEFGSEVAEAFRQFSIHFWRLYKPTLRSEVGGRGSGIPWAVILGLGGLAMEAQSNPTWANKLTSDEVDRAVRFALWELNELPPWFASLYEAHPCAVLGILQAELRWELRTPGNGLLLSSLRGNARLTEALLPTLIALVLEQYLGDVGTLTEALTVILRDPSPILARFIELAGQYAEESPDDEHKALWLAVLLCLNASRAVTALELWVNAGLSDKESERRITSVLTYLWSDYSQGFKSQHADFMQPDLLLRILKLTHRYVRVENDISHQEVYTPGPRDHAQQARSQLLERLQSIPGEATYRALLELSRVPSRNYARDHMLILAEGRAEADADLPPWSPGDVVRFAVEAQRDPASQKELFDLACARIDDLKLNFEEGDESEASLFSKVEDEPELRRALANRLKDTASEKYTTGSEEELADKTRTDIRLHNPRVDGRIPIEIKIAGKWSSTQLRERLKNQLVGQYMLEVRYGIFLVVNRGNVSDRKQWTIDHRRRGFHDLVRWLREEAKGIAAHSLAIDMLEVIGIDLTARRSIRDRCTVTDKSAASI